MDWKLAEDLTGGPLRIAFDHHGRQEQLAELSCFDGCTGRALGALADAAEWVTAEPGTELASEGRPADRVLVIRRGRVTVLRGGEEAGCGRKGDAFGEVAVLSGLPHSETLMARGFVELVAIEGRAFRRLLNRVPELAARVLRQAVRSSQSVA